MINNRQGGRRRGRGGQRPQGMPGNTGGNARDNRQRGNAAQLLEKYKNMARDAQLSGDRVQTEYYLQFADHYFRVLSESRVRFEEQRRGRDDDDSEDDGDDLVEADADGEAEAEERAPARRRGREREERPERIDRSERRPRGNGRPVDADEDEQRIPFDVLPPAIARDENGADEGEDEPKRPVRRTRRPRADDSDGDGATA